MFLYCVIRLKKIISLEEASLEKKSLVRKERLHKATNLRFFPLPGSRAPPLNTDVGGWRETWRAPLSLRIWPQGHTPKVLSQFWGGWVRTPSSLLPVSSRALKPPLRDPQHGGERVDGPSESGIHTDLVHPEKKNWGETVASQVRQEGRGQGTTFKRMASC